MCIDGLWSIGGLAIAIELVGLGLLIWDTIARTRASHRVSFGAATLRTEGRLDARLIRRSAFDEAAADDAAEGVVTTPEGGQTLADLADVFGALRSMTAGTQQEIHVLDQRLRTLVDERFREARVEAQRQADAIRTELLAEARRTAWRPITSTVLIMLGVVLASLAGGISLACV